MVDDGYIRLYTLPIQNYLEDPMRTLATLFGALLVVLALAACSQASPAAVSGSGGVQVQAEGGAYTDVTPSQLRAMLNGKDFLFVNVHIPYEGEIEPTDAFVPYDAIEPNLGKFPADKHAKIFLYCRSGRMSAIAARTLVKLGYTNVWNLAGGMVAWEEQGYPLKHK